MSKNQNQALPKFAGLDTKKYNAIRTAVEAGAPIAPADREELAELARLVEHARTAHLETTTLPALAGVLATGGEVKPEQVVALAISDTWVRVKSRAVKDAAHALEAAAIEIAPDILDTLQTKADGYLTEIAEAADLGTATPGELFNAGDDGGAKRARAARTAHNNLTQAVGIASRLGSKVSARTVRDYADALALAEGDGVDLAGAVEVAAIHVDRSGPQGVTVNGRGIQYSNARSN